MWKWLRGRPSAKPSAEGNAELRGAPSHARVKTYSAETGFVYQYVYRGYRPLSEGAGTEHVFEANRGGTESFRVTVHLMDVELDQCSQSIGRQLIAAERYALVKMSLFAALDEFGELEHLKMPLIPHARKMEEHLLTLGRI